MHFPFDNSYARELPGCYVRCPPESAPHPKLLYFNHALADELGLEAGSTPEDLAGIFSGNQLPKNADPIAQAYAGHQFGQFSPQLGDGRALLIGELIDRHGQRRDLALKGSGRTPFSRRGDGKAAVGPMLREVLIGEAMHALGIPTTRALAVVSSSEKIYRTRPLQGAILTRIAASHLRIGTFEYFAARGDYGQVRTLANYAIRRHDPALATHDNPYLALLNTVVARQARLIAQWMGVGFIHGVMNTDNMSIAGETIDYGPCAFMEHYDPGTVFSSIDEMGRYAYGNQPGIAQWNLARFAETLLPLLSPTPQEANDLALEAIGRFKDAYDAAWLETMRAKLGISANHADHDTNDRELTQDWLSLLHHQRIDYTLAWRHLADVAEGNATAMRSLFTDTAPLDVWLARWQARWAIEPILATERAARLRTANPWIIPRNHRVEEALDAAADHGDTAPFEQLLSALQHPSEERPEYARFTAPAPPKFTATYQTFCGT
jgi:uncharacterized protein YdiU (UPF0061 family)